MKTLLAALLLLLAAPGAVAAEVVVGSKKFTESVVLGEMATQLARASGHGGRHVAELGGSRVLWRAVTSGEIDIYPEYTGTLIYEILAAEDLDGEDALKQALAARGLALSPPLGFNNTYALGMLPDRARALGIARISDLARRPELAFGFSNEFIDRGDGWRPLQRRYRLPQTRVRGLDHDLAYRGLVEGRLDVIDLYSTDAEIDYYGLAVLDDDLAHFPRYDAHYLYRSALADTAPDFLALIDRLGGRLSADRMRRLNRAVKIDGMAEARVAAAFLADDLDVVTSVKVDTAVDRLMRHTGEHLGLVGVSLLAALIVAVPLGVAAARVPRLGRAILGVTGVIQTIPALALFVFMIPLLGIGAAPTIAALFLYSLLPIVRNTHAGLVTIPRGLRESAEVLGLPAAAKLWRIELPLALPTILAGVKTAAVINVGAATLGALIGAGGYGQPILTGIRLDDTGLILQGAVPAAALALLVTGLFDLMERLAVPRGLKATPADDR